MAVPERRVGNEEIAARIGVEPDWIVKRTGTSSRPWAVEGERVSDYASRAPALALERAGVSCLSDVTREAVSASGLGLDAVDLFVYHQANSRIIRAVGQRLGIDPERGRRLRRSLRQLIDCEAADRVVGGRGRGSSAPRGTRFCMPRLAAGSRGAQPSFDRAGPRRTPRNLPRATDRDRRG